MCMFAGVRTKIRWTLMKLVVLRKTVARTKQNHGTDNACLSLLKKHSKMELCSVNALTRVVNF
jgi:hypothetical protein